MACSRPAIAISAPDPPTYGSGDTPRLPLRAAWPRVSGPGAPLLPKRALTLAQELLTRGVQAIKADHWYTPPPA